MTAAPFVQVRTVPCWDEMRVPDGGRLFAVSELAGRALLLSELFDTIGFDTAKDLLVCVGSLCGPRHESQVLVDLLQEPWFRSVRGPADQAIVENAGRDDPRWLAWAADEHPWMLDLPRSDRWGLHARLNAMPDGIRVEHQGASIGIVHSGWPRHVDWAMGSQRVTRETLLMGKAPTPIPRDLDYLIVGVAGRTVRGLVRVSAAGKNAPVLQMLELLPELGEAARWRVGEAYLSSDRVACPPSSVEPTIRKLG